MPGKRGVRRGRDEQDAQGLVPGQDPEEGRDGKVAAVLLRGAERGRQDRGRKRRDGQPEHHADHRGRAAARQAEKKAAAAAGGEPARTTRTRSTSTKGRTSRSSISGSIDKARDRPRHALRQAEVVDRPRRRAAASATPRATGSRRSTCRPTSSSSLASVFVPGGAWAGLGHLAPEIGFQLTPDFAISIAGAASSTSRSRRSTRVTRRTGAHSVLASSSLTKQSQVRFFGAALAGGGEGFRFVVIRCSRADPGHGEPAELQGHGPRRPRGLAGVGGGIYYEAAKTSSIVVRGRRPGRLPDLLGRRAT